MSNWLYREIMHACLRAGVLLVILMTLTIQF